jgi:ubiquinone/menaquinone biosynthesis C-methylase UbiE
MDHRDHVRLIRGGVEGTGPHWLELGAGEGAFTLALAEILGPAGRILALDRDGRALAAAADAFARRFPGGSLDTLVGDFTTSLPAGPFDGVLAANSLHFVRDRRAVLSAIRGAIRPDGRLVVVEYEADRGNPWVPFPFRFEAWRAEATAAGFREVERLHRVPSRFLGEIYAAAARSPDRPDGTTGVLHSAPHGDDREE